MKLNMSLHGHAHASSSSIFPGLRRILLQQGSSSYRYAPLKDNEIRLIELRPRCKGPELFASLQHITVDEAAGTYDALSYTWGTTLASDVLLCGDSYVEITTNLYSALSTLRLESKPRLLWIDAVCINQRDLVERGTQVTLMLQIYQKASTTIVYLGDKSSDSGLAAAYLDKHMWRVRSAMADFMNQRRDAQDSTEIIQICAKSVGSSQEKLFEGFNQTAVQKALMNLLCRPWFRRIWVIQEFVVSPNVEFYCGKDKCEWGSFLMMFDYSFVEAKISWDHVVSSEQRVQFFRGVAQVMEMHNLRNEFREDRSTNLVRLLSHCRTAESTMAVDKIFALLSLTSDPDKPALDYLKSKAETYQDFAKLAITKMKPLFIAEALVSDRSDKSLPSWVPDWSETPVCINLSQTMNETNGWFFRASSSPRDKSLSSETMRVEGNSLVAKGAIVQTVSIVGGDRPIPGITKEDAPNLHRLINVFSYVQIFLDTDYEYPTGEDKNTVVWKLLEADQAKNDMNITSFWESSYSRDLLCEPELSLPSSEGDPFVKAMDSRRREDPQGYRNMCRAVVGRRCAFTDGGYIALVPDTTKKGDKVCLLKGLPVPVVVREVGEKYSLVGDAYIHGLMMGEAFILDETLEDSMTDIEFC